MNQTRLDYLCSLLSEAVYEPHTWRMANLLDDYVTVEGKTQGGYAAIGEGYKHNFVVFRGTELSSWKDIWTDLQLALNAVDKQNYRLHQGFFEQWAEMAPEVYRAVTTIQYQQAMDEEYGCVSKPWVFTGHSLGGAIAQIAAASFKPAEVVTFGSPRVGGKNFVDVVEDSVSSARRYVNAGDFCPAQPVALFGHRHAGELRWFDRKGVLRVDPPQVHYTAARCRDFFSRWKRHGVNKYVHHLEAQVCMEQRANEGT